MKEVRNASLYKDDEISFELVSTEHGQKPLLYYPEASGVLPIENINGRAYVWLVRQYRLSMNGLSLEIPAGKTKKDETPLDCAKRELAEEANLAARHYQKLVEYYPAVGISTEIIHLYMAKDLSEKKLQHDNDESFEIEKISFGELESLIKNQKVLDGKTILAYQIAKDLI
ncbi:MAG: NUDIX hydrolase [Spirochaetia bacterium]|nr:NUDIX hydrolase [Spirochaetia bacterium]